MKKFVIEFTLMGEGIIAAETEDEAHAIIKESLKKSAGVIGEELAETAELVHVAAKHLQTLSIIKPEAEPA